MRKIGRPEPVIVESGLPPLTAAPLRSQDRVHVVRMCNTSSQSPSIYALSASSRGLPSSESAFSMVRQI